MVLVDYIWIFFDIFQYFCQMTVVQKLHIKHYASHHFPKYFHIIKKAVFKYWTFFFRIVMVVRKNVLAYIIALVVAKNKVRLKKCLKKLQI
jgi:hypothetical protein